MKKTLIVIGIIILILILLWTIIFIINLNKCSNLEEPIFMDEIMYRHVEIDRPGTEHSYSALGYSIRTREGSNIIYESKMYLFGNLIKEAKK